jgi:hypothetical protein
MTMPADSPVLLSPGLGYPSILPLDKGVAAKSLFAIVASMFEVSGRWSLAPSPSNGMGSIPSITLIQGEARELLKYPEHPSTVDKTRDLVSREPLAEVLGGTARVFKVRLILPVLPPEAALLKIVGVPMSTMGGALCRRAGKQ